jgi:hypothetical protein
MDFNEQNQEQEYVPSVNLSKRPKRGKVINSEDISNLKINLETTKDVSEFLDLLATINAKADKK